MLKQIMKEILREEIAGKTESDAVKPTTKNLSERFYGRICMARTYAAGVFYGELVEKVGQEAILKNARRVYSWVEACSLSQLAMEGSKDISNCKIAMAVDEVILNQVIEIIPLSQCALDQLSEAPIWKR